MIKSKHKEIDKWVIFAICAIGSFLYIQSLGATPLARWDESVYINVARNMVQNGDWLIPHVTGQGIQHSSYGPGYQPFLEKPPFVHWLMAISMSIFDVSRFAARLPNAIFGILSGIVVYVFGVKLYNRRVGLIASIILMTTPMIFTGSHGARTGSLDIPLLFFGTLFVYFSWVALTEKRQNLLPLIGIVAGFAVLTKSANAGVFVIAIAPLAIYNFRVFITKETAKMIGLTGIITLPWTVYVYLHEGNALIDEIFLEQAVARATGERFARYGGMFEFMRYPYFQSLPGAFDPWFYFLIPASICAILYSITHNEKKKTAFLIWWATSTIVFFAFTGNHGWYLIPMFVPCSILISKMLSDTVERAPYAMIFTGLSVVLLFVYNDMNLNLVILMLGLALIILAKNIQNTMRRNLNSHDYNLYKNAGIAIICIIFVGLFAGPAVMDTGTNYNTQERLGQTAQVEIPSNELIVRGPKVPRAWPFLFYAQRPMEVRGVQYINQDTNLNYALIMKETQSQISREYTTIDTVGNYKLIQFQ